MSSFSDMTFEQLMNLLIQRESGMSGADQHLTMLLNEDLRKRAKNDVCKIIDTIFDERLKKPKQLTKKSAKKPAKKSKHAKAKNSKMTKVDPKSLKVPFSPKLIVLGEEDIKPVEETQPVEDCVNSQEPVDHEPTGLTKIEPLTNYLDIVKKNSPIVKENKPMTPLVLNDSKNKSSYGYTPYNDIESVKSAYIKGDLVDTSTEL